MLLEELYQHILPVYPKSARKDLKTAVKSLAQALNCPDSAHCPQELYHQPLPEIYRLIEISLSTAGKKPGTIKNTKNHLSRLFRYADAQQLLTLMKKNVTRRFASVRPPDPSRASLYHNDGSYLTFGQWPPALQADWNTYYEWATQPVVQGRKSSLRKRKVTMQVYLRQFESYFGYLARERGITDLRLDHVFNAGLLKEFAYWHVNERHKRVTKLLPEILKTVAAMARQYRQHPSLITEIRALLRELGRPIPIYQKELGWVSTDELFAIGQALWPTHYPVEWGKGYIQRHSGAGASYGMHAGLSLIFRLWKWIPYRQRNIREMKLNDNLYKNDEGDWQVRYIGEQLKVAERNGYTKYFELPWPRSLKDDLEYYLDHWRPLLSQRTENRFKEVFLNREGKPYTGNRLQSVTSNNVYSFTGKHWYPHLVRTVWTTEWLRETGNFYYAAVMLNDTIKTVIDRYAHVMENNIAAEVYQTLQKENHGDPLQRKRQHLTKITFTSVRS